MDINTKESYIEIGTSVLTGNVLANRLSIPAPHSFSFSDEFLADAERSPTTGTMIITEIGRTQFKNSMQWEILKNTDLWRLTRWFEIHGHIFYVKYFSHADGKVKIHRLYRGNVNAGTPSQEQEQVTLTNNSKISVPKYYKGYGFPIIDMGENNVIEVAGVRL